MDVKQTHLGSNKPMLNHSSIKRLMHFIHNLETKLSSVKTIHEKLQELISVVSKTHDNIVEELSTIKSVLNESTIEQKQIEDEIIPVDTTKSEWDEEDEEEYEQEDDDNAIDQDKNNSVHVETIATTPAKEFESKSVTNLSSKDQQMNSASTHRTDRLSLFSASSFGSSSSTSSTLENRPSSSVSKRSSNLKKPNQSSTRARSPKSVSFNFDKQKASNTTTNENPPPPPMPANVEPLEMSSSEIESNVLPMTIPNITNSNESFQLSSDLIPDLFQQHHTEVTSQPNIGFKLGNALTIVRIHEIEPTSGEYLRLLNVSNSEDYDLTGHYLQQNISCVPVCRFRFPPNTIIRSGQTVTIWCGAFKEIEPQFPHVFVWKEKRRWETGPECVTILAKPNGQAIAWARSSYRLNTDQSSSDILFVHSKSSIGISDTNSITSNSFKNRSRLSAYNFIGGNKPPFTQSPDSPAHPYHNGGVSNQQPETRSLIFQRGGLSQLLNRPKSSPFASHTGCKQDLISMKFLRKQQIPQPNKQTSVKT